MTQYNKHIDPKNYFDYPCDKDKGLGGCVLLKGIDRMS